MGNSYSSDQTTLNLATIGSDTLSRAGRARVTSIQGKGIASSTLILYDSVDATTPGAAVATYNYGTEGLEVYVPGSGILFKDGVTIVVVASAGATLTVTR